MVGLLDTENLEYFVLGDLNDSIEQRHELRAKKS